MERRVLTVKNIVEKPSTTVTQSTGKRLSGHLRIRKAASQDKKLQFNNLLTHISPELLKKAYLKISRKSKDGVDGVSWKVYGLELTKRLEDLNQRIHTGRYKPKPVKRIRIPKANGELRPIGITSTEDKIVQQALRPPVRNVFWSRFTNRIS